MQVKKKQPDSLTHLSVFENQEGQDTVFSVARGDAKSDMGSYIKRFSLF